MKLRNYILVTGGYWAFTLTDGALRMLVLLHFHDLGYSPVSIAFLFLLYEFMGILTNLIGGWVGARSGLNRTLLSGLGLQIIALVALTFHDAGWAEPASVAFVMGFQALSGVAKDLTKMSSKSYLKLVVPSGDSQGLLRWVALLTGSKNTLKGAGFFLGGVLLSTLGFAGACASMAVALFATLLASWLALPQAAGKTSRGPRLGQLRSRDPRVNWLSASRLFLFGARDIWFVLALPVFLSGALGWSHAAVGGFLASWVVLYGLVQASAPRLLGRRGGAQSLELPDAQSLGRLTGSLLLPLLGLAIALKLGLAPVPSILLGLLAFGVLFALNSAAHSYLILAYSREDGVALDVGFYYMANASGRLIGTLLSGALFQAAGAGRDGLIWCLVGSALFVVAAALLCAPLARSERAATSASGAL